MHRSTRPRTAGTARQPVEGDDGQPLLAPDGPIRPGSTPESVIIWATACPVAGAAGSRPARGDVAA